MARLSFLGGARTVTGSLYLVETARGRVMVDCGMFQGEKELRLRNWVPVVRDAASVSHVIVTHTHLDHIGRLPRLVREGFSGPVYCTPATAELAAVLLADAAHLQMEDAGYLNRKGYSKHSPALPLFDLDDVEAVLKLLRPVGREEVQELSPDFAFSFHDAGHLLGASSVRLHVREDGRQTTVVFSGDVGRYDTVLTRDPDPAPPCDWLVVESTYGGRPHPDVSVLDQLEQVLERTFARGGVLLVPAFAVGRAQQMLVLFDELITRGRTRGFPVHIDSPMAIHATRIYARHPEDSQESLSAIGGRSAFYTRWVHAHRSRQESEALNKIKGPAVILSSSGMLAGGRILHHCRVRLPHPENTLLITGYQAAGTLGRALLEGATTVRIHKQPVPVSAEVAELRGLSGHADGRELVRWLSDLPAPPRGVFVTHGEPAAAEAVARQLADERGYRTHVPGPGEVVEL